MRGSCAERKLPPPTFILDRFKSPAWYVTRAPTASVLHFLPTRSTPSQWFSLPTLLRSSTGAASLLLISTSSPPSLLKSPTARPRAGKLLPNTGPLSALTSLNVLPSLWKRRRGSFHFTEEDV